MQEDHIEENRIKLKKDIMNEDLDKDTIKKLRKLCIYGVRRNNGWLLTAADSFYQTLDKGKNFSESWNMATIHSIRYGKIKHTKDALVHTIFMIQIGKFTKRLSEVVPAEYNLDKVNYIKRISLMKGLNEELFEVLTNDWAQNVKKLWKSEPKARPAIKSHGKFWLRFVNFLEFTNPPIHLQIQTLKKSIVKKRDSMVKNFFESPIFEITKEEANDWSRI